MPSSLFLCPHFTPDAPARLKKDLDAILTLQSEVEKLDDALEAMRSSLKAAGTSEDVLSELSRLENHHSVLMAHVEKLYAKVNVDHLPEQLRTLPLEFVRMLLLARDIKTNLRIRATANFLEWDRLDRAAGGKDVALGM